METDAPSRWFVCVSPVFRTALVLHGFQLVSAKTASARLESDIKQERGTSQDLRKMLADERNVMSTMDMEHQQQLVELEQRHQEKVPNAFTFLPQFTRWCGPKSFILLICFLFLCPLDPLAQVHYFLNQLQSRAESDEAKQKDEGRLEDTERQQRLKVQVSFRLPRRPPLLNSFSVNVRPGSFTLNMWVVLLGGQAAGTD